MSQPRLTFRRHGMLALFVLGAVLIGVLCARPPAGQSSRPLPGENPAADQFPAGHFMAGGERAVPVLEEISATLKRVDERLARLEKIAMQAAEPQQ